MGSGCREREVGEESFSWTGEDSLGLAGRRKCKASMAASWWAWVLGILLEEWENSVKRGS